MPSLEELLKKHGIEAEASKLESLKKDHFAEFKAVGELKEIETRHEKAIKALEDDKAAITKERDQLKTTSENLKVDGMTPEDVKKLKADFEAQSKQIKDREEADKKKAAASEFEKAFDAALGERKFSNSLIRDSVVAAVRKERESDQVSGISDLIEKVTKDQTGIFENPNKPKGTPLPEPGKKETEGVKPDGVLSDDQIRSIAGLSADFKV